MDLKILKTTDYELECYVVDEVPPKLGKTRKTRPNGKVMYVFDLTGGSSAIRTRDQRIKSPMLYRLS